ncbi:MAG: ABC transporter ATP-binding protein [Devosia sp.]|nr:ABC transporter ATP-binding protein [Devosia sp.]
MSGLVVNDLTVRAGGRTLVAAAGFRAPMGQVTGLVGPNGAGKSTLLSGILGIVSPATGVAEFAGQNLMAMDRRARAQLCAYVEQSANTEERISVIDVVGLGRIPFQTPWQRGGEDDAIVAQALADVGLATFAGRLYSTLSGGERQRVQIARALAQQPRLLVLDEPTSHLDISAQLQVLDLLRARTAAGMTVVIALHDLNLAMRYCDHLVMMSGGAVVAEGTPSAILSRERLGAVYGVAARSIADPETGGPVIVFDGTLPR